MASKVLKCANCNIVINEVLCFIQNKVKVVDEESISRICVTAFSDEQIKLAKDLLFESISKRKKNRKKDGKSLRDIDDIITTIKETDEELLPVFTAKDLERLPPVLFNHVDVTRILKDQVKMQDDIKYVKNNYATTYECEKLRQEIEALKNASIVNNFPCNFNEKRGAFLINSYDYDNCNSGPMGLAPLQSAERSLKPTNTLSQPLCPNKSPIEEGNRVINQASDLNVASAVVSDMPTPSTSMMTHCPRSTAGPSDSTAIHTAETDITVKLNKLKKPMSEVVCEGEWRPQIPDEKWVYVQKKRLRNRFMGNTGKAVLGDETNFKAADIQIPLYIYRVAKQVKEDDIIDYIRKKTELTLTVKKNEMKISKDYNGYIINVPRKMQHLFMKDDFWPEAISYRRFIDFSRKKASPKQLKQLNGNGISTGK